MKNENLKNNMKSTTWSVLMHSSREGFDKKPMIDVAEDVVRSWDATTMIVEKNEEIMIFILSLKGEKAVEVHVRCDENLHMGIVSCYLPIWLKDDVAVKEFFFDMNDTLINKLQLTKNHVSLQKSFYYHSGCDFKFVLSEILGDLAMELSNIYRPLQLLEVAFGVKEDLEVTLIVDLLMNRVTEEDDDDEDFLDF